MRHTLIILLALFAVVSACEPRQEEQKTEQQATELNPMDLPDSLSSRRIEFLLKLKQEVGEKAWPKFSENRTEGSLIYYQDKISEVFFPNQKLLKKLKDFSKHSEDYILAPRVDDMPFHFEVMISFDESDSLAYFFDTPVEQFNSVEETGKFIPSVKSTEMWATMAIHEMFHHFQYNQSNFQRYAKGDISSLPFDIRNLVALCREKPEYLAHIQKENDLLLAAIDSKNIASKDSAIANYLLLRAERIEQYADSLEHLEKVENYYIIQEGSARYIEYQTMLLFNQYTKQENYPVVENDSIFKSYSEFKTIDFKQDEFNYLIYAGASDYHYAIGFSTMRLLDQLQIEYKETLVEQPQKALHQYLEEYLKSKG